MIIKENDFNQMVKDYLLGKGCTIVKQEVRQGSVIADMMGCIVNDKGELENKVVVEIKSKPSPADQKRLFTIAKRFNTPYLLLVTIENGNKLKYYWFETESGLPIIEQTFESSSNHVISESDIEKIIWNALDLMREMAIRSDESFGILLSLLLIRVYLCDNKKLDTWNSLDEDAVKSLANKSAFYYKILEHDTTRIRLNDGLKNLLSILSNLPVRSKQYQNIAVSVLQKTMGREMATSSTPSNLLNIVGRLSKALEINDGKVMNLGSGMGSLLREVRENTSADIYEGVDLNINVISQSKIINIISGYDDINIKNISAFKINDDEEYKLTVINPPIGVKVRKDMVEGLKLAEGKSMINISEAFIEKAINITRSGGYIISVVQDGSLFSGVSKPIRDIIIERTIVKAIISLPENIFRPFATVKSSILVLEKKGENIITPKNLFIGKISTLDDTDEVINGFEKWLVGEGNYGISKKI